MYEIEHIPYQKNKNSVGIDLVVCSDGKTYPNILCQPAFLPIFSHDFLIFSLYVSLIFSFYTINPNFLAF